LKMVGLLVLASLACASAAAQTSAGTASGGRANVCAAKDMTFDSYREIKLPAKTVFKDSGLVSDNGRDPWNPQGHVGDAKWAAFVTTDPVTLTKAKPCAESRARMLIGPLMKEPSASASDRRIYEIDDVLEYAPASGRPPVEFGKLIDDISIQAVLLNDASDPLTLAKDEPDEAAQAAKCLAGAQLVAAHEGGIVGRQTHFVVFIRHPAAEEFSYGCDEKKPNLNIAWNKARPAPVTVKLVTRAVEFLTGAPSNDTKQELAKCINEALKPDAGENSTREFGGVRIECGAFERDGGGGSATIFRRFGAYPVHDAPGAAALSDMQRASAALKSAEDAKAEESLKFAKWWLDPTIPPKVKSLMLMAARIQALADRCPTWKPNYAVIADAFTSADISAQDIQPGGKYFETFSKFAVEMSKGTEAESREEACQTAKSSYGESSSK